MITTQSVALSAASPDATVPHLAWPPRLADDGTIGVVDQDSPEELAQAAALTLYVPIGALIDNPAFGTPDQTFRQSADGEAMKTALTKWEPRLTSTIVEQAIHQRVIGADITVQETTNG